MATTEPTSRRPAPEPMPAPEDAEVHLHFLSLELPPGVLADCERSLSIAERDRADRFRFEHLRNRYLAVRGQLRAILGRYLARAPADLRFDLGPFGKPAVATGIGDGRLHFNLSRSGRLGLVAVRRDEEVGVDIEELRPFDDALAIAERTFAPSEHRALMDLPERDQVEGFFRYWTRKEAVVKSIGRGLSESLAGFSLGAEWEPEWVLLPGVPTPRWVAPVPETPPGFVAALATAGPVRFRRYAWPPIAG